MITKNKNYMTHKISTFALVASLLTAAGCTTEHDSLPQPGRTFTLSASLGGKPAPDTRAGIDWGNNDPQKGESFRWHTGDAFSAAILATNGTLHNAVPFAIDSSYDHDLAPSAAADFNADFTAFPGLEETNCAYIFGTYPAAGFTAVPQTGTDALPGSNNYTYTLPTQGTVDRNSNAPIADTPDGYLASHMLMWGHTVRQMNGLTNRTISFHHLTTMLRFSITTTRSGEHTLKNITLSGGNGSGIFGTQGTLEPNFNTSGQPRIATTHYADALSLDLKGYTLGTVTPPAGKSASAITASPDAYLLTLPGGALAGKTIVFTITVAGPDGTEQTFESRALSADLILAANPGTTTLEKGKRYWFNLTLDNDLTVNSVSVSDFAPGNGSEGEDTDAPVITFIDGTQPIDQQSAFDPLADTWIVSGGGTPQSDATVLANVRTALNRVYEPQYNGNGGLENPYNDTRRIHLMLTGVVSLPKQNSGHGCFENYGQIATVSLPTAQAIGENAFGGSTNLADVTVPAVQTIEASAFGNCTRLSTISLPAAQTVGVNAFNGCTALADINLPATTKIGDNAFKDCRSLVVLRLPAATLLGIKIFDGCTALTNLELGAPGEIKPDEVETFRNFDTTRCYLTLNADKAPGGNGSPVVISDISWGNWSWAGIYKQDGTSMLPPGQGVIDGTKPFAGQSGFDVNADTWVIAGGGTPQADANVLGNLHTALNVMYKPEYNNKGELYYPYAGLRRIKVVLTGILTLPLRDGKRSSLEDYGQIAAIELPRVQKAGKNAFSGCINLTAASLPLIQVIEDGTFMNCSSLNTLSLPDAKAIRNNVFSGCRNLTKLIMPLVTEFGQDVFSGCTALTTLEIVGKFDFNMSANTFRNFDTTQCALKINEDKLWGYDGRPTVTPDGKAWHVRDDQNTPAQWKAISYLPRN